MVTQEFMLCTFASGVVRKSCRINYTIRVTRILIKFRCWKVRKCFGGNVSYTNLKIFPSLSENEFWLLISSRCTCRTCFAPLWYCRNEPNCAHDYIAHVIPASLLGSEQNSLNSYALNWAIQSNVSSASRLDLLFFSLIFSRNT